MLKFIEIVTIGSFIAFFLGIGSLIYFCSSWATSGEVGSDIGEFAGEIEQGYKSKKGE